MTSGYEENEVTAAGLEKKAFSPVLSFLSVCQDA